MHPYKSNHIPWKKSEINVALDTFLDFAGVNSNSREDVIQHLLNYKCYSFKKPNLEGS